MIPSFTTVEWAIIGGGVVSSATLVFVFLDFYWSHIVTERSNISIRKSLSRESNHNSTGSKSRIYSPCTLANEGKRSGVVRAKNARLRFEPSGTEFTWEEMEELESNQTPYMKIQGLDNNSVPADSTVEASVRFGTRSIERLNSLMESQESIMISGVIDVEDNQGHYQIDYADKIELG
ncbi:hypothetical protein [Halobacterium sp. R2-5]|uniref:hypothetical protein n=1 Tax=Halobacterium sp. R2-5 TaxID=2715751 RepID=UPI00141E8CA2|nr:hypothetical protein [Halobacterium sp. R2-5]NIB99386.1 hypothetical protein [Halobacterium sp. R2-5]